MKHRILTVLTWGTLLAASAFADPYGQVIKIPIHLLPLPLNTPDVVQVFVYDLPSTAAGVRVTVEYTTGDGPTLRWVGLAPAYPTVNIGRDTSTACAWFYVVDATTITIVRATFEVLTTGTPTEVLVP